MLLFEQPDTSDHLGGCPSKVKSRDPISPKAHEVVAACSQGAWFGAMFDGVVAVVTST